MICFKCGSENLDDARFCTSCGVAMDEAGDIWRAVSRNRAEQECFGLSWGALPGLVIGVIIIIVGVTSAFGRDFGEGIGRWGESVGRFFADWGIRVGSFFADWGTSVGRVIGSLVVIIIGLIIMFFTLYGRGRK